MVFKLNNNNKANVVPYLIFYCMLLIHRVCTVIVMLTCTSLLTAITFATISI